jgi:hypothetical protein
MRSYIQGRIPRLQRQRTVANVTFLGTFALCIALAAQGNFLLGCLLGGLSILLVSAVVAVINLHVDQLSMLWRDLDRDMANELFDFEIPMR